MGHPRWEFSSVVMEVVGFFLVTIELYGEQRLREYHTRLVTSLSAVRIFKSTEDEKFFLGPAGYTVYPLCFIAAYLLRPFVAASFPAAGTDPILYASTWVVYYVLIWPFLVMVPILTLMIISHWLIQFSVFVLSKVALKGVFVTVGALLFLTAKTILAAFVWPETGFSLHALLPW
jgi:hypothetical protein